MNPRFISAALVFILALSGDVQGKKFYARLKPHAIEVTTDSIDFDRTNPQAVKFGRLTWRGGLVLNSKAREFGGYSGVALFDRGEKLLSVSDQGSWLSADLVYKNGRLVGLKNTRTGPLKARNGKNLRRKKYADAEDIALWRRKSGPYALISFERKHRIGRFPISAAGVIQAPKNYLKLPRSAYKSKRNKGIEAVTVLTDKNNRGTVLAFAEKQLDKKGRHKGWLIRGDKSWPIRLSHSDDFLITGLATLPNGNVLVLERSFSLFTGIRMRIREIRADRIRPKAHLKGKRLIRASMRFNIDNMEGISAHKNQRGETIITLMSDNNFNKSGLQRTLLMQFRLD